MHPRKPAAPAKAWERIYRPIDLPTELLGQAAPCDLFNDRGVLLIKAGTPIPMLVHDPLWPMRLFCEAQYANTLSQADPLFDMQQLGAKLTAISERLVQGASVSASELSSLTRSLFDLWSLDSDACLGLARLSLQGQPSAWHAMHVALLGAELALAMGLDAERIRNVMGGALSMNLATMALHDEMFNQHGPLNETTREALHRHPKEGVHCLQRIGKFQTPWLEAVAAHHENIDGTGYPSGLKGADIPLTARILRVADTLAARLTGRRLRPPQHWNLQHARDLRHLVQHVFAADLKRLDQPMSHRLLQVLSRFPPGSLVRLSNSELAIVTRRQGANAIPRHVLSLFDPKGQPYATPQPRRIGSKECVIRSYAHDTQRALPAYDWKQAWGYGLMEAGNA